MVSLDNPAWSKAALTAAPSELSGGPSVLAAAKNLVLTAACAEAAALLLVCRPLMLRTNRFL